MGPCHTHRFLPTGRAGTGRRRQDSNELLTNTPDLTCSGRDGPTVPHRGRPRPAPTRQPVSVWRFTPETESHDAISAFRRGICQSHHLRWVFALHLRHEGPPQGAAASRTTTKVRAHDSPMGRGRQHVPKARIQTSETEVGGRPRRPP